MTQQIILCYRNILETSTVAPSSENTDFPAYRLYDRDIGKLFKANGSGLIIIVTQGGTDYDVDRLIIPAGHNLSGKAIDLSHAGGSVLNWTQSGAGLIDKPFTSPGTKNVWTLTITGGVPELTEMFLTKELIFVRNPNYGLGQGIKKNVERFETQSGLACFVKLGEIRQWREYSLTKIGATQKADLVAWEAHCEGIKSFYIEDHDGTVFFAELSGDLQFHMEHENRWALTFQCLEVLP